MQAQLDDTAVDLWLETTTQYGTIARIVPCIALRVASTSDSQESGTAHLTVAEARRLAAELLMLVDALTTGGRP